MLHLMKLAVGIRDIAHLQQAQRERRRIDPPLRHCTRNMPRLADDITVDGSMYWVIGGMMLARQRVIGIRPDQWDDGSACAALLLANQIVPVAPRRIKPFQGWRYLQPADAPPDLAGRIAAGGEDDLPPALRRVLQELCLL